MQPQHKPHRSTTSRRSPECDAPFLKVVGERRELNGTLYRNAQIRSSARRRALVRRRRHAARLSPRERPRQLAIAGWARRSGSPSMTPAAPCSVASAAAAGCAGVRDQRRRRCLYHLPRGVAGAGGSASSDGDRARHAEDPRLRRHDRAIAGPFTAPEGRSVDRRTDVLRYNAKGPLRRVVVRIDQRQGASRASSD